MDRGVLSRFRNTALTFSVLLLSAVFLASPAQAAVVDYPDWASPLGSEGVNPSGSVTTAVAAGPGGSSYVTGYIPDSAMFGSTTLISQGGQDAFVAKVNADGSYAWAKLIGGTSNDQGKGIAVDSAGNAYITGYNGTALTNVAGQTTGLPALIGSSDAFVVKLDSTGAYSYAKQIGGISTDQGTGIAVDSAGNAYITGYNGTALTNVAGQTTGLPALIGGTDAFVVKLGSTGTYSYAKAVGGTSPDTGYGIAVDSSSNAYITGSNSTALTNVAGQTTGLPAYIGGPTDSFVVKLTSTGAYSYAKAVGGTSTDQGRGIAVDSAGNAYITGYNNAALTNVAGQTTGLPALIGGRDAFVVKLTSTGAYSYAKLIGGSGYDQGQGIAVDSAGNAYIVTLKPLAAPALAKAEALLSILQVTLT